MLYSEIAALGEQLEILNKTADMLRETFEGLIDSGERDIEINEIIHFEKSFTKLVAQRLSISSAIDHKRKMMLDIDKENVMTISAALRSIPKQPEKKENPLLSALRDDGE